MRYELLTILGWIAVLAFVLLVWIGFAIGALWVWR